MKKKYKNFDVNKISPKKTSCQQMFLNEVMVWDDTVNYHYI